MKTPWTWLILAGCSLLGGLWLAPSASALVPATGGGISVDGLTGDWDLTGDYLAPMYRTGNPARSVLSHVYMRYDCASGMLAILVLDNPTDGLCPLPLPNDAWVKIYGQGWPNHKLIDGSGNGNTSPRDFEWVYNNGALAGYEAIASLPSAVYSQVEVHLNIGGETSSSGKYVHGNAIALEITCTQSAGVEDSAWGFSLEPNHPNPFNPSTRLLFTLQQTGPARLTVHDLQGRRVATLVDGLTGAGTHSVFFDGSRLASGMYLATLEAQGRSLSRALILQK